mgnify:CR=1 FL=1
MTGQGKSIAIVVAIVLFLIVSMQSFFVVDQTQRAVVLYLGKPIDKIVQPGLHFKIPFVQKAIKLEHRILEYDSDPSEIITEDKKTLVVDNYARWRIENPLKFYQTAGTLQRGVTRLDDIVYSELRVSLGSHTLNEIVSSERNKIMHKVTKVANRELKQYGIKVVDVRIKRTDLPQENEKAIFDRMRSERQRQAKRYRSEGQEEAAKIRAKAKRNRTVMLADANKKANVLKGEGDAKATAIYGKAYSKDSNFYSFVRSLDAYKQSLDNGTKFILTPESKFFEHIQ